MTNCKQLNIVPLVEAVRAKIQRNNMRLTEVEAESGVDVSTLSRLLSSNGQQGINVSVMAALAKWSGTSLDKLAGISEPPRATRAAIEAHVQASTELEDAGKSFVLDALKTAFKHFGRKVK